MAKITIRLEIDSLNHGEAIFVNKEYLVDSGDSINKVMVSRTVWEQAGKPLTVVITLGEVDLSLIKVDRENTFDPDGHP